MQVAAGWGVTGLTADTAGRLYDKVRGQLGVAQPPQSLRTDYTEEYFAANAAAGVSLIEPPSTPTVRSPRSCSPPPALRIVEQLTGVFATKILS